MPKRKEVTQTIVQDNAPADVNWRGDVAPAFASKRSVLDAMSRVTNDDNSNVFRAVKRGSRWFLQIGQPVANPLRELADELQAEREEEEAAEDERRHNASLRGPS